MDHNHNLQCGTSLRDYFAGQLLTSIVAGVLGLAGILMFCNGQLWYILAPQFHPPVLFGGAAVLVLVALRMICVWREAGQVLTCGHCHHSAEYQNPDQGADGHSHDLSWVCTRLLILSFPVSLFLLGVPNSGFSQARIRVLLGADDSITGHVGAVGERNGTVASLKELNEAANDEGRRESVQGQTAILEGRIHWIDARQFTLFRLKMTCCGADAVALKVRVVLKNCTLSGFDDFDWIQMKGRVQFVQAPNSEQYIPVIVVEDIRDVRKTEPNREYDYD
jgi:hypothetical protein